MRRTILQKVNLTSIHAIKNNVIREQTQQVPPKIYCKADTGRFYYPFATMIGLALSLATGVLVPQKGDSASAAEPLINLTNLKSSTTVPTPLTPTNTSKNSSQSSRATQPSWVSSQANNHPNKPVQPLVISRIDQKPIAYRVQPKDTVETIASNYQIPEQELVKVNRLNNPNVIQVDQVLKIPSWIEPGYAIGGDGSAPATLPSVITAAQPSGIVLPTSTSQVENTPVAIAPTTDSSKFRVATGAASQPQVEAPVHFSEPEAVPINSSNNQADTVSPTTRVSVDSSQRQTKDLQSDIQKLRAKYSTETGQSNSSTVAAKPSVTSTTQPASVSLPATFDRAENAETEIQERARTIALTPKQKPIATVSVGSNYIPIAKRTSFPQLLHPELPPLTSVDSYLPNEDLAGSRRYIWPAKGVLTSGYGMRWGRMHQGIDVAAPIGTPVMAAAVGIVVSARWSSGGYGNLVNILHPDGSLTRYAHNKRLLVRSGQEVNQGQPIAEIGSTGRSTGPHLHFEIRSPGRGAVNPMLYLSRG